VIYTRSKSGLFPPPIKLTQRASAWPAHEIEAIAAAMIAGSTDDEMRALVKKLVARRSELADGHATESRA
jgi:prophage regulatory protein